MEASDMMYATLWSNECKFLFISFCVKNFLVELHNQLRNLFTASKNRSKKINLDTVDLNRQRIQHTCLILLL